jgi:hypothetical protein
VAKSFSFKKNTFFAMKKKSFFGIFFPQIVLKFHNHFTYESMHL